MNQRHATLEARLASVESGGHPRDAAGIGEATAPAERGGGALQGLSLVGGVAPPQLVAPLAGSAAAKGGGAAAEVLGRFPVPGDARQAHVDAQRLRAQQAARAAEAARRASLTATRSAAADIEAEGAVGEEGVDMPSAAILRLLASSEQTQRLLTQAIMDREDGSLLSGGASSSSGDSGLRGYGAVMRNRATFFKNPLASWDGLELRLKTHLSWNEGESWSAEDFIKHFPWGTYKSQKRFYFLLAKIHRALRDDDICLVKGLVAQGMKMSTQTVLDHGSYLNSWTMIPYPDPTLQTGSVDPAPPPVQSTDMQMGLAEPHEMASAMRYLTDQVSLAKARGEKLQVGRSPWTAQGAVEEEEQPSRPARRPPKRPPKGPTGGKEAAHPKA